MIAWLIERFVPTETLQRILARRGYYVSVYHPGEWVLHPRQGEKK